jgi:hypothetical protein
MKTFSIVFLLTGSLFFSAHAQDQSYAPNARQAVQKSRMQQPQYVNLTKEPVDKQQENIKATSNSKIENYLLNRPVAIDAPKRRAKKSGASTFAKLANYSKK